MKKSVTILALALGVSAVPVMAQDQGGAPPAGEHRPPPGGLSQGGSRSPHGSSHPIPLLDDQCIEIDDDHPSPRLTFQTIPVPYERLKPVPFKLPDGRTHWYEVVYLPQGGVNWVQAKWLAEQAGGYLVTCTSKEENDFVFGLIKDPKFWFRWGPSHNGVMNGPFLGAYKPKGAFDPKNLKSGWRWVTGEPWSYTNWAYDGEPGDRDPRDNTQPNNSTGGEDVAAFGEVNDPVPTWGDFPHKLGTYHSPFPGQANGFIIEYEQKPKI